MPIIIIQTIPSIAFACACSSSLIIQTHILHEDHIRNYTLNVCDQQSLSQQYSVLECEAVE